MACSQIISCSQLITSSRQLHRLCCVSSLRHVIIALHTQKKFTKRPLFLLLGLYGETPGIATNIDSSFWGTESDRVIAHSMNYPQQCDKYRICLSNLSTPVLDFMYFPHTRSGNILSSKLHFQRRPKVVLSPLVTVKIIAQSRCSAGKAHVPPSVLQSKKLLYMAYINVIYVHIPALHMYFIVQSPAFCYIPKKTHRLKAGEKTRHKWHVSLTYFRIEYYAHYVVNPEPGRLKGMKKRWYVVTLAGIEVNTTGLREDGVHSGYHGLLSTKRKTCRNAELMVHITSPDTAVSNAKDVRRTTDSKDGDV